MSNDVKRRQQLAESGFSRRPGLWAMQAREALELIAAPKRPDGTWNRDREACRQIASEALGRYEDDETPTDTAYARPAVAGPVETFELTGPKGPLMTMKNKQVPPAPLGPVRRMVRPLVDRLEDAAHAWENNLTVCGDHMPSPAILREAKAEIERLRALIGIAPNYFHPGYDFDGEKLKWLKRAGLVA